jgi:hypothetical protein
MGKILPGPWAGPRKEQAPFPILFEDLSQDMRFFSTEARQVLQHASTPFRINSDINPIHCRKALNVLENLHERLDKLCQSLSRSASLAIMLSPSRYPVLIDLHLTQKNASRLMDQLDDYRVSCLKPSHRLYPQRREIMTLFDKVIRQVEDIPNLFTSLEKDMEVQEQRLRVITQQKIPATHSSKLGFAHGWNRKSE